MEGMGDLNRTEDNEAEALHLKRKECDHSSQPDNRNMMESTGSFISSDNDWPDPLSSSRSPEVFTETLEGQVLIRCGDSKAGAEWPPTSPCNVDDPSVTVEELRLKNYNGSNLSIVGCSNSRDKMPMRKGQWQHLYQLAGGSGNMNSCGEDVGNIFLPKSCNEKPLVGKYPAEYDAEVSEHLINNDNRTVSSEAFTGFPGGIRTKVLPASGFSQFFVKNTLKGKGVLYRHPGTRERCGVVIQGQNKDQGVTRITCDKSQGSVKADDLSRYCGPGVRTGSSADADLANDGVSIREWLNQRSGKINKAKNLHLFQHILEVVDIAHSQGVVLSDIRPSCFLLLPSDKVKYVGSWGPQIRTELSGSAGDQDAHHVEHHFRRKRQLEQGLHGSTVLSEKQQKLSEHMNFVGHHPAVSARCGLNHETFKEDHISSLISQTSGCEFREQKNLDEGHPIQDIWASHRVSSLSQPRSGYESIQLEERWYASPEELKDGVCKLSSNIYSLGVLLFELLYCFESWEMHATAMSDLRHRVLPPNFLSENPKEAGFCLWLLHPEPSSRPKTREILQSDLICEARNLSSRDQSALSVGEEDAESELLLHFLITLKEQKQTQASKLVEDVGCLDADIGEVEKRHSLRTELLSRMYQCPSTKDTSAIFHDVSDECILNGPLQPATLSRSSVSWNDEMRLMRNINQLENAYFSMRSKINLPETDGTVRADMGVLKTQHRWTTVQNDDEWCMNKKPVDCLGSFFDGVCKYARYSKFEVRGTLRNEDILNSANVICSLSFDRDEEYFAAAGVSKKIKIFELGSLLNDMVDIHYPVVEMSSKSKLSCVCWNNYIKNYLASTDYDGVVQLWDASTGQGFSQYAEHQKRAWSVDFSQLDPTKLASGSDDCSVKLWSINEESCVSTIRNVANICCVQFSSYSPHVLVFGSADYKIYCYDLRNTRIPWCTLTGHGKAVSYVKFLDPVTLVSASTDNTLKLWDLKKTSSSGFSPSACSLTLSGHTNEKNFVGLSVSDGYISCGSETNEVYAYYKSLPMPITSHKFGSIDAITGQETGDDNGQFVSSVCWRGKENMVVAANSNGSIKLLQLV